MRWPTFPKIEAGHRFRTRDKSPSTRHEKRFQFFSTIKFSMKTSTDSCRTPISRLQKPQCYRRRRTPYKIRAGKNSYRHLLENRSGRLVSYESEINNRLNRKKAHSHEKKVVTRAFFSSCKNVGTLHTNSSNFQSTIQHYRCFENTLQNT